jgi:outer membrane receptor protein involved in Fe transport
MTYSTRSVREPKLQLPAILGAIAAAAAIAAPQLAISQTLDEIVTTARKTGEENLQDVPLAITAIGAEQIDRLGVRDLDSLAQQDTSVQFDEGFNPSDTRITIRGLSPTRGRPNAATLIDGIDITSEAVSNAGGSLLIDPRLIDVQQIDIVKGPQSALYGRSAFAGAVQYVTKDPDDVLGGEIFVEGSDEKDSQLRGNMSIPISDVMGVRLNGLLYDNEGYYTNPSTGGTLGGAEGYGGAATFVFEPRDEVKIKWRTEYSVNEYAPPAQSLLNDLNQLYDLGNSGGLAPEFSNLAPQTSNCFVNTQGTDDLSDDVYGFLDNYSCAGLRQQAIDAGLVGQEDIVNAGLNFLLENGNVPESDLFLALLSDPSIAPLYFDSFQNGGPANPGNFDVNDPELRNLYNKQVGSIFAGDLPDADGFSPTSSPDYRKLADGDEALAKDYQGNELTVFRTSLVFDWDIADDLAFASYSAYTNAEDDLEIDLGKWYVDECRSTAAPGENPIYASQECGPGLGDGINDIPFMFAQDSINDTTQVSQEFRLTWDVNDDILFTTGLLYWRERVTQDELNLTLGTGGPVCYLFPTSPLPDYDNPAAPVEFEDSSYIPNIAEFLNISPEKTSCGNTWLPAAYLANDVFEARKTQPSQLKRETDHYSWYGRVEWNFTDQFKTTFEWRFAKEDNAVIGPQQSKCLDIEDAVVNPDGSLGCDGPVTAAQTGPSAVLTCGQTGRCDTLEFSPDGLSWWDYGLLPQQGLPVRLERSDRTWAPKVTFEYAWTDEINTYFSWSRGIKPGGFSLLTLGAFGIDANNDGDFSEVAFDPERLDVWELGAKTDLFDNRVRLNGAIFFQDFKDKQVSVQEVTGDQVGTRVQNIDGSEIFGAELTVDWQATDNLFMNAGYTYLDSEYTDYTVKTSSFGDIARTQIGNGKGCLELTTFDNGDPACLLSYNGNELERTPKHAFQFNGTYTAALFDTGNDWYATVNYRYQDERWLEQYNITKFQAYSRTNASVGIESDVWNLQLYVNNLFDDDTVISGGANPGLPTGSFGFGFLGTFPPGVNAGPKLPSDVYINLPDPRVIGLRLNLMFGG